jgi:hypothetical protein
VLRPSTNGTFEGASCTIADQYRSFASRLDGAWNTTGSASSARPAVEYSVSLLAVTTLAADYVIEFSRVRKWVKLPNRGVAFGPHARFLSRS